MMDYFKRIRRQQQLRRISTIQNICAIAGATLLGLQFGWMVGWGVGLLAWAVMPVIEV